MLCEGTQRFRKSCKSTHYFQAAKFYTFQKQQFSSKLLYINIYFNLNLKLYILIGEKFNNFE
jgi:hypothetical protein